MRPTIRDVARRLNLSITTVSRALDGYTDVAVATRQLVVRTAQEMGYVPNRAARQLRRRRTETVGFILPGGTGRFDESFFSEFIAGLGDELAGQKFDLLVSIASDEQAEYDLYQRWLSGSKVDGFVLNRVRRQDWRMQFLAQQGKPFVALGCSADPLDYPCVQVDGSNGFIDLVRHVRENGFKRFAFVGGPDQLVSHIDRLEWFRSALEANGLAFDPAISLSADMTSTGGYQVAQFLLALPEPPDAILCVNDETAFGVLHAAHERGLAVGREIAVAGFDGVQDTRHTEPPLTTLDIPVYEIARLLVRMLLAEIAGDMLPDRQVKIKPVLLTRASTGS